MCKKSLPPLREVIKTFNLEAKKELGQNFLLDLNVTKKIASLAGDLKDKHVIEIGPGPGGLTRALLELGAKVTAIEKDKRCKPALNQLKEIYKDNFTIIYGNALTVNYNELAKNYETKLKIIANLPYNISTKLLTNWLLNSPWPPFYESLTLMFQKEVAERIIAKPSTKSYGRLSVLSAWRTDAKIVYNLPARAFTPPPKVDSAIVHITLKKNITAIESKNLELVTGLAFEQRRKMLRKSLSRINGEATLAKLNIDSSLRAENLTIEQFIAIAQEL